jgi:hypothetical protein
VKILKPHLQTTVFTLLAAGKSQREIARITAIDRKAIRALERRFAIGQANSPGAATGSVGALSFISTDALRLSPVKFASQTKPLRG